MTTTKRTRKTEATDPAALRDTIRGGGSSTVTLPGGAATIDGQRVQDGEVQWRVDGKWRPRWEVEGELG